MFDSTSKTTYVCVPCRQVAKSAVGPVCPGCRKPMHSMGKRWRAPRRRDESAWRLLAAGQGLTEPPRASRRGPQLPYRFTSRPAPSPRRVRKPDSTDRVVELLRADPAPARTALLLEAAGHPDERVRRLLATSADCPETVVRVLLRDADPYVRADALAHPGLPEAVRVPALWAAARSKDYRLRAAAAAHPSCPARPLAALLRDRSVAVHHVAALNPSARPADLLGVPFHLVPAERLGELWAHAAAGHAAAVAVTGPAVRMLTGMRRSVPVPFTGTPRPAREVLAAVTAALT